MPRKSKPTDPPRPPYFGMEHIKLYDSLEFDGEMISPGQKVKIKNKRGLYTFRGWVHNTRKDVQWLDLMEDKTGQFRQFYIEQLRGVVKPKRSRKKNGKSKTN